MNIRKCIKNTEHQCHTYIKLKIILRQARKFSCFTCYGTLDKTEKYWHVHAQHSLDSLQSF